MLIYVYAVYTCIYIYIYVCLVYTYDCCALLQVFCVSGCSQMFEPGPQVTKTPIPPQHTSAEFGKKSRGAGTDFDQKLLLQERTGGPTDGRARTVSESVIVVTVVEPC